MADNSPIMPAPAARYCAHRQNGYGYAQPPRRYTWLYACGSDGQYRPLTPCYRPAPGARARWCPCGYRKFFKKACVNGIIPEIDPRDGGLSQMMPMRSVANLSADFDSIYVEPRAPATPPPLPEYREVSDGNSIMRAYERDDVIYIDVTPPSSVIRID